jgi:hypothetical protein
MTAILLGRPKRRLPDSLNPIPQCPVPVPRDILGQVIAHAAEMAERYPDRLSIDELNICRAIADKRPPVLCWRSVGWLFFLYGKVTEAAL